MTFSCRDSEEVVKPLSDSERAALETQENKRLDRDTYGSTSVSTVTVVAAKPAKEKGLKIYFNTDKTKF